MTEKFQNILYQTKTNDVDEKGIVTVAVNGIGILDSQNDISMSGSFDKTLKNDINRMRWFLNHKQDQLLGVPISGEEKDGNLVMVGKINLDKQIGRDTLSDYKLFAENGRTLEHSIGVQAIARDKSDTRKVLEWRMLEFSTLTNWGSNPQTGLLGIKSQSSTEEILNAVGLVRKAMQQRGYSEERLKSYDMQLKLLIKSLEGGNIVKCPNCGCEFDYDQEDEVTYEQQVLETASNYHRWITENVVSEEMHKLKPEIRQNVLAILDSVKAGSPELTEKSIQDLASFVRCPHCWARVYRALNNIKKVADEAGTEGKQAKRSINLKSINEKFNLLKSSHND